MITLQEAIELLEHDLLTNRFRVTHYGGCAILFNKDTFFSDIKVSSFHECKCIGQMHPSQFDSFVVLMTCRRAITARKRQFSCLHVQPLLKPGLCAVPQWNTASKHCRHLVSLLVSRQGDTSGDSLLVFASAVRSATSGQKCLIRLETNF